MNDFALPFPPSLFEQLAARAAELVDFQSGSPWMNRKQAADYLGLSVSLLEHDKSVPSHKRGGRVFYNRHELDAWVKTGTGA